MVAITGVCGGGEEDVQSPSTRDPDVEEIIFTCAAGAAASRRVSALMASDSRQGGSRRRGSCNTGAALAELWRLSPGLRPRRALQIKQAVLDVVEAPPIKPERRGRGGSDTDWATLS